jgi:hypothetical protein
VYPKEIKVKLEIAITSNAHNQKTGKPNNLKAFGNDVEKY